MCLKSTMSPIIREDTMTSYSIANNSYQVELYDTIDKAANKWAQIEPRDNTFLQVPYFRFLEDAAPTGIRFRYLVFTDKEKVVGIAYIQLVQLKVGDALTDKEIPAYQQKINAVILKMANMNAIISGNLLLTGDHGTHFSSSISTTLSHQLLQEGLDVLKINLKQQKHPVSLQIIKDIGDAKKESFKTVLSKSYNEFTLQPNMVLDVPENWESFDDYLQALTSKSRVRAKRAFKLGKTIRKKEFTIDLMKAFLPQIDSLYKAIADNAGFNVVYLSGAYFLNFKEHFPEKFRVFGYFIEEELIAFYTTFQNHEELEAHFLGFDSDNNRKYQAYLNILFDIIRLGITTKSKQINFARTALEIKSSVGAKPVPLYYFGKHTNAMKNHIFSPVLSYFQPKVEWKQRNPFKKIVD